MRRIQLVPRHRPTESSGHLPPNCTYTRARSPGCVHERGRARRGPYAHRENRPRSSPPVLPPSIRVSTLCPPWYRPSAPAVSTPWRVERVVSRKPRWRRGGGGGREGSEELRESAFYVGRLDARGKGLCEERGFEIWPVILRGVARCGASYRVTAIQATKSKYS